MGKIILASETVPAAPAAGLGRIWMDSTAKIMCLRDDTGIVSARSENASIAALALGAADTWVTDSDMRIPSFGMQARTMFRWVLALSKGAAGAAAPAYTVRIGAARSVADTARLVLNGPLQTAVADDGILTIYVTVRNIGAAGVLQGDMNFDHNLAATGFANNATAAVHATSAGFDNTAAAIAGLYISLSVNAGAAAAWTLSQLRAEAKW